MQAVAGKEIGYGFCPQSDFYPCGCRRVRQHDPGQSCTGTFIDGCFIGSEAEGHLYETRLDQVRLARRGQSEMVDPLEEIGCGLVSHAGGKPTCEAVALEKT